MRTFPLLRTLAADSLLALAIKVLSLPLGYYTLILLARLYGAEAMGTYTLGAYLLTTLAVVCRLGLDTGVLRFLAAAGPEADRHRLWALLGPALLLVTGTGALAGLGLWAAGGWLAQRFQAPQLPHLLFWVAWLVPLCAALGVGAEALRALGGVRWVVCCQNGVFPGLLLFLLLVFSGWVTCGPPAAGILGLALALSHLGAGLLLVIRLGVVLRRRPGGRSQGDLGALLRYSAPLFANALLLLAYGSLDSLLLSWFQPPAQVAYLEAAGRTALLVSLPLVAVNAVLPPLFSRLHQEGELRQLEALARAAARWTYYLALPLALGCLLLAPQILGWFGAGFEAGALALRLLALAQLVNVACGSVGFLLAMTGHQLVLTRILALTGLTGLPLMALGAAMGGLTGLAAAKALWLVGVNLWMSLAVRRCLGLTVWAREVLPAHLAGGLAAFIFALFLKPLGPLPAALLFGLTYCGITARPVWQEMALLTQKPLQEGTS